MAWGVGGKGQSLHISSPTFNHALYISVTYRCLDRQRCFTGKGWARELIKMEAHVADCHNMQPPAVFLSRTLSCCQMAGCVVIDVAALVQLATRASRRRDHRGYKGNTSGEVRLRVWGPARTA